VAGIYGRTLALREAAVRLANDLGLGPCRGYDSIDQLVADDESIDAVWATNPVPSGPMRSVPSR